MPSNKVFPNNTQCKDETVSSSNFGNITAKSWTYDYKEVKMYVSKFRALAYKAGALTKKFKLLAINEMSSNKIQKLMNTSDFLSNLTNMFLDLSNNFLNLTMKKEEDGI